MRKRKNYIQLNNIPRCFSPLSFYHSIFYILSKSSRCFQYNFSKSWYFYPASQSHRQEIVLIECVFSWIHKQRRLKPPNGMRMKKSEKVNKKSVNSSKCSYIHIFTECWRWEYDEEIISSLRLFFPLFQACRFACSYHSYMHAFKPTFSFAWCFFTSPSQHRLSIFFHHIFFSYTARILQTIIIRFFASSFVWSDVFLCTRTWRSAKSRTRERYYNICEWFRQNVAFCYEF